MKKKLILILLLVYLTTGFSFSEGFLWKNFRNSDVNMAITDTPLPGEKAQLLWAKSYGTGWSEAPSVPLFIEGGVVIISGEELLKLDPYTGEVIQRGPLQAKTNFGYTPMTYAEGLLALPLSGGTQVVDAKTFESLWFYEDDLGGQSLSPISYKEGIFYTGYWMGERREANFVALDAYSGEVLWKFSKEGGFYWAGSIILGDYLVVGSDDGDPGFTGESTLYSIHRKTGEVISTINLYGDQRSSMAYDAVSDRIYFTTKAGMLYSVRLEGDGTLTELLGVNHNNQMTSTPVVYEGLVYVGAGSGISTEGSTGRILVCDASTLEEVYSVPVRGYPQGSVLLSTAGLVDKGTIEVYFTYNSMPGGVSMITTTPHNRTKDGATLSEIYEASGYEQYNITSLIHGPDGTLYFKNDSAHLFALGHLPKGAFDELVLRIQSVEDASLIKQAREAYDKMSEEEKSLVEEYQTLLAWEEALKLKEELSSKDHQEVQTEPPKDEDKSEPKKVTGGSSKSIPGASSISPRAKKPSEALLALEEKMKALPEHPRDEEILEIYRSFISLEKGEQGAFSYFEDLEEVLQDLKKKNHNSGGFTLLDAPWYVKLETTLRDANEKQVKIHLVSLLTEDELPENEKPLKEVQALYKSDGLLSFKDSLTKRDYEAVKKEEGYLLTLRDGLELLMIEEVVPSLEEEESQPMEETPTEVSLQEVKEAKLPWHWIALGMISYSLLLLLGASKIKGIIQKHDKTK